MTPLDAMAEAFLGATSDVDRIDQMTPAQLRDGMRAALLALAKGCELSRQIREAGAAQLDLSDLVREDMWLDMGDAFRAMVDEIAKS